MITTNVMRGPEVYQNLKRDENKLQPNKMIQKVNNNYKE